MSATQVATVHFRVAGPTFDSLPIRFGSSDAVQLLAVHYSIEGIGVATIAMFMALSKNPEHELVPPAEIAEWATDEALYGRGYLITGRQPGEGAVLSAVVSTIVVPLYNLIVPSRQIVVRANVVSATFGMVAEVYFRSVEISRDAADTLNRKWGKYTRS